MTRIALEDGVTSSSQNLDSLATGAVIYLLLAIGRILPLAPDDGIRNLLTAALVFSAFLLLGRNGPRYLISKTSAKFMGVALMLSLSSMFQSTNLEYAIAKIDGALLSTCIGSALLIRSYKLHGRFTTHDAILHFAIIVLSLTFAYKYQHGITDRTVRFFINGPIVFGWFMGLCVILSLDQYRQQRKLRHLFYIILFASALIWTESKGPLLATASALIFYLARGSQGRLAVVSIASLVAILAWMLVEYEPASTNRLSALTRILHNDTTEIDEGSVGIRKKLVSDAWNQFLESPVIGIGLGEFSYGEFTYPHNQHLEVFLELGLVAGIAHALFLFVAFARADHCTRSVLLLFTIATSFSGDIPYLRFIYLFALTAITLHIRHSRSP